VNDESKFLAVFFLGASPQISMINGVVRGPVAGARHAVVMCSSKAT
jgi:hypothetical protein